MNRKAGAFVVGLVLMAGQSPSHAASPNTEVDCSSVPWHTECLWRIADDKTEVANVERAGSDQDWVDTTSSRYNAPLNTPEDAFFKFGGEYFERASNKVGRFSQNGGFKFNIGRELWNGATFFSESMTQGLEPDRNNPYSTPNTKLRTGIRGGLGGLSYNFETDGEKAKSSGGWRMSGLSVDVRSNNDWSTNKADQQLRLAYDLPRLSALKPSITVNRGTWHTRTAAASRKESYQQVKADITYDGNNWDASLSWSQPLGGTPRENSSDLAADKTARLLSAGWGYYADKWEASISASHSTPANPPGSSNVGAPDTSIDLSAEFYPSDSVEITSDLSISDDSSGQSGEAASSRSVSIEISFKPQNRNFGFTAFGDYEYSRDLDAEDYYESLNLGVGPVWNLGMSQFGFNTLSVTAEMELYDDQLDPASSSTDRAVWLLYTLGVSRNIRAVRAQWSESGTE